MEQPTPSLLRDINRSAVLNMIRERGPIARSQIARELHISLPTVMRVVDELVAGDLVYLLDEFEYTGGRPRPLLAFNADKYVVIGVDLGSNQMVGAVADLSGKIQKEICCMHSGLDADENSKKLFTLITQLLETGLLAGQMVRGIGVAIPGITLHDTGTVVWAPSLQWRDLPLGEMLSKRFGLPVFVENDVNLMALGEWGFGACRGTRSMAAVIASTGVGAGLILDGNLYRGHRESAGEIGYFLPGVEYLGRSYDLFGPLEPKASASGMLARARTLAEEAGLAVKYPEFNEATVLAAARDGQAWAQRAVDETVDHLALAAAAISAIIDPEMIVFGGTLIASGGEELVNKILGRFQPSVPSVPRLVASQLGWHAIVLGTIMLALHGTGSSGVASSMADVFYNKGRLK